MIVKLDIRLEKREVLRYLGYKDGITMLPSNIDNLIDRSMNKAYEIIVPLGLFETYEVNRIQNAEVSFKGVDLKVDSRDIALLLEKSRYVSIMAVSIGKEIHDHIDELFKRDEFAEALIFDAIGSDAAEKAANALNMVIGEEAIEKGFFLTRRFSPGYGDFDLTYQKSICNLIKTNTIELSATEHNILIPKKSITAILGWTKDKNKLTLEQKCENCNLSKCSYKNREVCNISKY